MTVSVRSESKERKKQELISALQSNNIQLLSEYVNAAHTPNHFKCLICNYEWDKGSSVSSMVRGFKKHNTNGCPQCAVANKKTRARTEKLAILLDRGFKYISDIENDHKRVQLEHIDCGHIFTYNIYQDNINSFQCPQCTDRYTKRIVTSVSSQDHDRMKQLNIILTSDFTGLYNVNEFQCTSCGTQFTGIFRYKLNTENPCPSCLKQHLSNIKKDASYIEKLENNNNIKILGEYKGAAKQHLLKCNTCDHEWYATPGSKIRARKKGGSSYGKCPKCNEVQRNQLYERIRSQNIDRVQSRGIEILDSDYDGKRSQKEKIYVRNNNCGHEFFVTPDNLFSTSNGVVCPVCNTEVKRDFYRYHNAIRSAKYFETASEWAIYKSRVASHTIRTYEKYIDIINPENNQRTLSGVDGGYQLDHIMSVRYCFDNQIPSKLCAHYTNLQMLPWYQNNSKSKKCGTPPVVFEDLLQHNSINDWFIFELCKLSNNITIKNNIIFFKSYKKAFELCLFKDHVEQTTKNKLYNLNKYINFKEQGYRLYQVYQDEWINNSTIVLSKIKHLLGCSTTITVYARKCNILLIDAVDKNKFLDQFHIQGADVSKYNLGAYYNGELVAVMTFCKPRILFNYKKDGVQNQSLELSRFATNYNYNIPGIASKLLTYAERTFDYSYIFSYADIRWSDGNVYRKLGFVENTRSTPSYYYIIGGDRTHRWGFRKDLLGKVFDDYDSDLTEYQNMINHNIDRVWDCGTIKYVKYKK
jgi:hypothetical protein